MHTKLSMSRENQTGNMKDSEHFRVSKYTLANCDDKKEMDKARETTEETPKVDTE